jgi:hypothetical protein
VTRHFPTKPSLRSVRCRCRQVPFFVSPCPMKHREQRRPRYARGFKRYHRLQRINRLHAYRHISSRSVMGPCLLLGPLLLWLTLVTQRAAHTPNTHKWALPSIRMDGCQDESSSTPQSSKLKGRGACACMNKKSNPPSGAECEVFQNPFCLE